MYTVDYFIKKFEALSDGKFCINVFDNGHGANCANGHCGVTTSGLTEESRAFQKIFSVLKITTLDNEVVQDEDDYSIKAAIVNNGKSKEYRRVSPKQRILAALYDIKKLQQPEVKEKKVYVVVHESITEQAKELVLS